MADQEEGGVGVATEETLETHGRVEMEEMQGGVATEESEGESKQRRRRTDLRRRRRRVELRLKGRNHQRSHEKVELLHMNLRLERQEGQMKMVASSEEIFFCSIHSSDEKTRKTRFKI